MGVTSEKWMTGTLTGVPTTACLLGELVAVWSFLEHTLPKPLAKILGITENAAEAILFALNNTSARIDIVKTVATRHASDADKAKYLDALVEIDKVSKIRNAYMHQLVGYTEEKRLVRWDFRSEMSQPQRRVYIRNEDIEDAIMQMRDCYNLIIAATAPEIGAPPPWRSKRFKKRS